MSVDQKVIDKRRNRERAAERAMKARYAFDHSSIAQQALDCEINRACDERDFITQIRDSIARDYHSQN